MKKVIIFVFFYVLTFQSWAIADAANPISVNAVNVNGKFIATDVSPIIEDGRVLVPIRTLASLGVTYQWDNKSQSALITKDKDQIKMTANEKEAFKNNKAVQVDVPVQMIQGRILVPIVLFWRILATRQAMRSFGLFCLFKTVIIKWTKRTYRLKIYKQLVRLPYRCRFNFLSNRFLL